MTKRASLAGGFQVGRRTLIKAGAATFAAAGFAQSAHALPQIEAQEFWAMKGGVKLYVYRKRATSSDNARPVLFLVHGSSAAGRGTYDLIVPGRTGYSAMDHFAGLGYDVWTMDHEGYGYSDRTGSNSDIQCGADDLTAAFQLVAEKTGRKSLLLFGESSGALRAGVFAAANPGRVDRLILHAFTYTGENAPEIERRRKQVDYYRANPRRPFGMKQIQSMFDRDVAGKADPAVIQALADFELKFGDSVPSGTYLDMATKLPLVDPKKLTCAVCITRAEHDGNASEAELLRFFDELATKNKQFTMLDGMTHAGGMVGPQRQRLWYIMHGFFNGPAAEA
jgi:alpha-beta hydrolase superfamily lysophospholipase